MLDGSGEQVAYGRAGMISSALKFQPSTWTA
jgi:hypothetical protein